MSADLWIEFPACESCGRGKAKRQPSAKRPPSVLPDGWDRTTAPREPRRAVDKIFYGVPVVTPMHPVTLAAGLIVLRDTGADDLAEVLGVSPDQIRAEADRWLMWEGSLADGPRAPWCSRRARPNTGHPDALSLPKPQTEVLDSIARPEGIS